MAEQEPNTDKQLGLADILAIDDVKTKRLPIPEWGGHVTIRRLTAEARDAYEMSIIKKVDVKDGDDDGKVRFEQDMSNIRAKLIAVCVLGPDGKLMFSTPESVKQLGTKSNTVVDYIFSECQKFNKISDADIKELAGN